MKTINRNALNLLFEKAESLGEEPHESWRCVYFKFSDKPEKHNHELYTNFIVDPIISLLESSSGYIYLCEDGDIFILFQGALRPVANKLSTHFGDITPDSVVEPTGYNIFRAFDLDKHWEEFYELCESKYLKKVLQQETIRMRFQPNHIIKTYANHKPA